MDDVVPMPGLLELRPDLDFITRAEDGGSKRESLIAHFDLDSQSSPECSGFQGVRVFPDFLSPSEAEALLCEVDRSKFAKAQSGKWKQHYGPKINFNKKKMNAKDFRGLPDYARRIENRLRERTSNESNADAIDQIRFAAAVDAFEATDVFVLRYRESDESNLDFHLDDTFAYGELILDLSLESDSVLTFMRQRRDRGPNATECVRVPLPARSLAAIYGRARFDWEHAILSYDVTDQRTSITLRSLHENLRRSEAGQRVIERVRGSRVPR